MWKDATTYSRGTTERIPTAYRAKSGKLDIYVTCGHINYKGEWIMHCFRLGIVNRQLYCENEDQAKKLAIAIVKDEISSLANDAKSFSA